MDIKDFILISGGLLIALVIGHGFWIAWRAKREPLRMDIVPDLIPDDVDDMERLRGELPNGGARVVNKSEEMQQTSLALDMDQPAPLLMDVEDEVADDDDPLFAEPKEPMRRSARESSATEVTVADVELTTEPKQRVERTPLFGRANRNQPTPPPEPRLELMVEELLILNVLAPRGDGFIGEDLVNSLQARGLRYGEMNIFHRVDPATKAKLFSVANAVEPGTFDLSDVGQMRSPGVSFFMQLPGPEEPTRAFDAMLDAARNIALDLGGELKDENLSVFTVQTAEHMRERIADFARRRLSKRA